MAKEPRVRIITVIEVVFNRGSGDSEDDPVREIIAYHDVDGGFLAERDVWMENRNKDKE